MSFARDPELARRAAAVRRPCGWCEDVLRPCNLARHVQARHFRQLTIDEILDLPPRGFGYYPDEWTLLAEKYPDLRARVIASTEAEAIEAR